MNDLLLKELGNLARHPAEAERAHLDERWDRLAAGTLTAEEEIELRALATSSPEAGEAYVAFKPLGAEFQARVANAINAQRPEPPAPQPVPLSPWIRRMVWIGAATAVAVGVYVLVPPRPPLPLPVAYTAHLNAGDQTHRGGEPEPANGIPTFSPGSRLELDVSPGNSISGQVEAQAFLSSSAGEEDLKSWTPESPFKIAKKGGAVSLVGTLGQDLQIPLGDWTIWVVVARPRKAPRVDEVQAKVRSGRPPHEPWRSVCTALRAAPSRAAPWQISCVELRIKDQPPS